MVEIPTQGDVVAFIGGLIEPPAAYAIRSALLDYPGCWSVHVDQDLVGGWWLVTLSAEGFHHSVLVPPRDQSPGPLRTLVEETILSLVPPAHLTRYGAVRRAPRRRPGPRRRC